MDARIGTMRADLIVGGAATILLMGIAYTVLSWSSLAPPPVIRDIALLVTLIGAAALVLGLVLRGPRKPNGRRTELRR